MQISELNQKHDECIYRYELEISDLKQKHDECIKKGIVDKKRVI